MIMNYDMNYYDFLHLRYLLIDIQASLFYNDDLMSY